jgi:hypothetical protein
MGRLRQARPQPALVVAVVALVAALAGTAVASDPVATTSAINKKKVKKIANKQIDKRAPDLSVASAESADNAATADSATTAQSAARLAGLAPGSINVASQGFGGGSGCDPGTDTVCASTQLQQPRRSDVLVLAAGTFWGNAGATGRCTVDLVNPAEPSVQIEVGQATATHTSSDSGDGFSLPHLFQDVPAGSRTFQLKCNQETGDLHISASRVVAVRLSG